MGLLVKVSPLPPEPYVAALKRIPGLVVWTDADAPPADRVEAILAWRLPDGVAGVFPNLRLVSSVGAGVDKIVSARDLPAAVAVSRIVDPMQALQIAQYVVAQTLRHTRDGALYAAQQARADWQRHPVRAPDRCRVGVLGMGQIGQAISRAFEPLGYAVAGWSRGACAPAGVESFVGDPGLQPLLARSDILVCALPLTAATNRLLNRERLAQLPRGAFVINIGRGEHLVEDDLRVLLDDGHLAGAALDVFEREPPPREHWLWAHPKLVATPHIAAQASFDEVARQVADALRRLQQGERPLHEVDRTLGY